MAARDMVLTAVVALKVFFFFFFRHGKEDLTTDGTQPK